MSDKHLNKCKVCVCAYARQHRKTNPDYYKQYESARSQTTKRKVLATRVTKEDRAKHPDRYKARTAVNNAIKKGLLLKTPCELCNDSRVEAHHVDYSEPLQVIWLCAKHHRATHFSIPY